MKLNFYEPYAQKSGGDAGLLQRTFIEYNLDLEAMLHVNPGISVRYARDLLRAWYELKLKLTFLRAFGLASAGAQMAILSSAAGSIPAAARQTISSRERGIVPMGEVPKGAAGAVS